MNNLLRDDYIIVTFPPRDKNTLSRTNNGFHNLLQTLEHNLCIQLVCDITQNDQVELFEHGYGFHLRMNTIRVLLM